MVKWYCKKIIEGIILGHLNRAQQGIAMIKEQENQTNCIYNCVNSSAIW